MQREKQRNGEPCFKYMLLIPTPGTEKVVPSEMAYKRIAIVMAYRMRSSAIYGLSSSVFLPCDFSVPFVWSVVFFLQIIQQCIHFTMNQLTQHLFPVNISVFVYSVWPLGHLKQFRVTEQSSNTCSSTFQVSNVSL